MSDHVGSLQTRPPRLLISRSPPAMEEVFWFAFEFRVLDWQCNAFSKCRDRCPTALIIVIVIEVFGLNLTMIQHAYEHFGGIHLVHQRPYAKSRAMYPT